MIDSPLVWPLNNQSGDLSSYLFWCVGCEVYHSYDLSRWKFNGNKVKPTFTPSLLIDKSRPDRRCHLFVTDGKIRYCGDCHHGLKGQTVDMVPFDENGDLVTGDKPGRGFRS